MTIEDIALMKNKMYFGLVGTPKKDQRFVRFTTTMWSFALSPLPIPQRIARNSNGISSDRQKSIEE